MPSDSDIRRAISTAYYALFHTVAADAAGYLIDGENRALGREAWSHVYRALDHATLKNACRNQDVTRQLSRPVASFADLLPRMQRKRHLADYDPLAIFLASEVRENIDECETAIAAFAEAPEAERRVLVAFALFRTRANLS